MKNFYIILISLFALTAWGQTSDIVLLNQSGVPIENAYISFSPSQQHTHTNQFGRFSIAENQRRDTLFITQIGYRELRLAPADLPVSGKVVMISSPISISEIVVEPLANTANRLSDIQLKTNPVTNSQEILRQVPGIIIGQHAGGGKAEQIFLRGFDIDHGTDISLSVDGMPVNMVSHAHGQGYADLHFVLPEAIERVEFGKGPYQAEQGNFTTAGFVNFKMKERLDNNVLQTEIGQFNTQRYMGMFNLVNSAKHAAYVGGALNLTDGPFETTQNFSRVNFMGRYTGLLNDTDKIWASVSHFQSEWDASGQIPQRAVDQGLITRFGAIDDTEGGNTSRTNLQFGHTKTLNNHTFIQSNAYYSHYDFELFSNFTFFLDDPENGDQIRQYEDRNLFGLNSTINHQLQVGQAEVEIKGGIGFRTDRSNDNELSETLNRKETLNVIQLGDIQETNAFTFAEAAITTGKFTFIPGLRYDQFKFVYNDAASATYDPKQETDGILSPKMSVLYTPNRQFQAYLKTGKGFHSNDTRVVVNAPERPTLPAAYGADAGVTWKPFEQLYVNAAYWYLFLEQEFVYVGDAGVVEPSGKTNRHGLEVSARYQPLEWLYFNGDVTYTIARSSEDPDGENYIPLAPDFTATGGAAIWFPNGVHGGLQVRHIDNRPANEDNSIIAEGYTVFDANVGYTYRNVTFGVAIQNLFDTDWNETQFATTSRLRNEDTPVEEIHFTPGTPFNLRGSVKLTF